MADEVVPGTEQSISEVWERAEKLAEAKEAADEKAAAKEAKALDKAVEKKPAAKKRAEVETVAQPEPKAEEKPAKKSAPKKVEAVEEEAEEEEADEDVVEEPPAPAKAKSKPEPEADEDDGEELDDSEELDDDSEEDLDEPAAKSKLEKLAKKLGYRLEGAAVTTEERVGFRAEKRKWRTRIEAEQADLQDKLHKAENFYAPMLAARKALEADDIDAALEALGMQGGLSEANKRMIERASGQDPRVTQLEKQLHAEREERLRAQRAAQEQEQTVAQQRAEANALQEIGSELESHPRFGPLAANEALQRGILKIQQEHWDGDSTLTAEDAAAEYIQLMRSDKRAKLVYEVTRLAFGGRDADEEPETKQAKRAASVDQSNESSARPGKAPKTLPKRRAAEASSRSEELDEVTWRRRAAARMAQSTAD
jgi:hypothetical protein